MLFLRHNWITSPPNGLQKLVDYAYDVWWIFILVADRPYANFGRKNAYGRRNSLKIIMIEFKNISFGFDEQLIFDGFSDKILDRQKVAVVGKSGCGKSTLLNLIAGFLEPQKGQILIDNNVVNSQNIATIRQNLIWLPQNFNIPFDTINDLFFSIFDLKINKKFRPNQQQIEEIFSLFNISTNLLTKKIDEVSGGQKQRILLASVLLTDKKYILLDEPTSSLDEQAAQTLFDVLLNYKNKTVIMATHNSNFVQKVEKRIII